MVTSRAGQAFALRHFTARAHGCSVLVSGFGLRISPSSRSCAFRLFRVFRWRPFNSEISNVKFLSDLRSFCHHLSPVASALSGTPHPSVPFVPKPFSNLKFFLAPCAAGGFSLSSIFLSNFGPPSVALAKEGHFRVSAFHYFSFSPASHHFPVPGAVAPFRPSARLPACA
jgi:hypothetical protein